METSTQTLEAAERTGRATRRYVEWQAPQPSRSPRSRRLLINVAVLIVAVIAVAVPILTHHGKNRSVAAPTTTVVTPPDASQAEQWLQNNVPTSSRIVADPLVAQDLKADGFDSATADPTAWRSADYLVSTPALRAGPGGQEADLSSVPIAQYGGGDGGLVSVRKVLPSGTAGVVGAMAADYVARQSAGLQILANPQVGVDAASRTSMMRGALDVRAETLIALIAAQEHVTVSGVQTDPAEDAAGIPARILHLSVTNGTVIDQVLSVLPAVYRPDSAGTGGERDLTWAIAVPPVQTLH